MVDASSKNIFRNMLTLFWGVIAGKALGFLIMPLITRLYNPDQFGVMSVLISFLYVAAPMLSLRYSASFPIYKRSISVANAVVLSLLLSTILFAFSALAVFILSDSLHQKLQVNYLRDYWVYFAVGAYLVSVNEIIVMWGTREHKFKAISLGESIQAGFGLGGKLIGGLMGWGGGLIAGQIIQQTTGCLTLFGAFVRFMKANISKVCVKHMMRIASVSKGYPIYRLPSHFMMAFSMQSPVIFVASLYGMEFAGQMGLAVMALSMPVTIMGKSLSGAYYSEISVIKKDRQQVRRSTYMVISKLFFIALLPSVILWFFGREIFSVIFGGKWSMSGDIASKMSVYLAVHMASNPVMNIFNFYGGQYIYFAINTIRFLLILIVFFVLAPRLEMLSTITIYSYFMAFYYALVIGIVFLFLKKATK
jgi:O-antigen/teichoic acid export membrane protein